MKINYYRRLDVTLEKKGSYAIVPFEVLNKDIQYRLRTHDAVQDWYFCSTDMNCFSLYLNNGDKMDVQYNSNGGES